MKESSGALQRVVEFMVTAGRGQNDFRPPRHCLGKHEIGRRVAGVQGNNQMHVFFRIVFPDVAVPERQSVKVQFFCYVVAVCDDIRLEIDARHADLASSDVREIVVDREGEIAFAAAEVADAERAVFR